MADDRAVVAQDLRVSASTCCVSPDGWLLERFDLVDAADRVVKTCSGGVGRRLTWRRAS